MVDQTPVAAPGITAKRGEDAWKAPGSGTPLQPGDAVSPSPDAIANEVARRLTVPRGPLRTVGVTLGMSGSTIVSGALNSTIIQPILGGPGFIPTIDIQAQIVTTGAAAGLLMLSDGDSNMSLLRTYPINVGAAGSYQITFSSGPGRLPFLNGILARWVPITAAFGNCIICLNVDFDSIPIGQRLDIQ